MSIVYYIMSKRGLSGLSGLSDLVNLVRTDLTLQVGTGFISAGMALMAYNRYLHPTPLLHVRLNELGKAIVALDTGNSASVSGIELTHTGLDCMSRLEYDVAFPVRVPVTGESLVVITRKNPYMDIRGDCTNCQVESTLTYKGLFGTTERKTWKWKDQMR
jgi:hypothetical protein